MNSRETIHKLLKELLDTTVTPGPLGDIDRVTYNLFRVYIRETPEIKLSEIVLNRSRNHIEDNVPVKVVVCLFVVFFRKLVHFKRNRFGENKSL